MTRPDRISVSEQSLMLCLECANAKFGSLGGLTLAIHAIKMSVPPKGRHSSHNEKKVGGHGDLLHRRNG
jgi:hypothetical protein